MKAYEKLHYNQRKILILLRNCNGQRYSELYKHFSEIDRFPYHLKQLTNKKLVRKRERKYFLTLLGNYHCTYIHPSDLQERQLKIPLFIFICEFNNKFAIRKIFTEDKEIGNYYILPNKSPEWGENLIHLHESVMTYPLGK